MTILQGFELAYYIFFIILTNVFVVVSLIICMAISLIDQTVKIFIPARHFDWGDIPFDIIGFCCGLAIAWVVKFAAKKLKEE